MQQDHQVLDESIRRLGLPFFLVKRIDRSGGSSYVFHTCSAEPKKVLLEQAMRAIRAAQLEDVSVSIKSHKQEILESRRSLEALMDEFGGGDILYDPTGAVRRGGKIVGLSSSLRRGLGHVVSSVAFEPRRRALYVVLNEQHPRRLGALKASLKQARDIVEVWHRGARPNFDLAVRVGFELPPASWVVAADRRSVSSDRMEGLRARARRIAAVFGLATAFGAGAATSGLAADTTASREPAVSQPNVTVVTKTGVYDEDYTSDIGAKVTMPLGDSFGFHIEGQAGTDGYVGLGGELFWRDPEVGLLGAYASYENLDDVDMTRIAAEAELYLNQVTLGVIAGSQTGDVEGGILGRADIRFYATPDFMLRVGGEISPGIDLARIGAEWRPGFDALPGLSIFADGEFGDDYAASMMGLRLHFGGSGTTLIDRDRREDPSSKLDNRATFKDHEKNKGYDFR